MSNICKTVTLRTRKIKKGTQLSFYLDYYPSYRDESTMKVQRHESLGIYIFAKPKNQRKKPKGQEKDRHDGRPIIYNNVEKQITGNRGRVCRHEFPLFIFTILWQEPYTAIHSFK